MYLSHLSPSWQEFHTQRLPLILVVVLCQDKIRRLQLSEQIADRGYSSRPFSTVKDASSFLQSRKVELIVGDLNLLSKLPKALVNTSTLLAITIDRSKTTLELLLNNGVHDYIATHWLQSKLFMAKVESLLDQPSLYLVFDVVISDLRTAILSATKENPDFPLASSSLLRTQNRIAKIPHILILDSNESHRNQVLTFLTNKNILIEYSAATIATVPKPFPWISLVTLETEASLLSISAIRQQEPKATIITLATENATELLPLAIKAGADDFCIESEQDGTFALSRIRRALKNTRRNQLFLEATRLFNAIAQQSRPDLASNLVFSSSVLHLLDMTSEPIQHRSISSAQKP